MQFSLYPANDPAQQLRIKRFFLSLSMYALYTIPLGLTVGLGISPLHVAINWAVLAVAGNTLFYVAFRLDYNKRCKDASLTVQQMSLAIASVLYTQIYAGPVRAGYLYGVLIIFVFGCFRLRTGQLLLMSAITSAVYAATIPVVQAVEGERFNLPVELVLWLSLSVFLPFLSILAGGIHRMQKELSANKAELQKLLERVTNLATHDELTGVYNRRWLLEMLAHEKKRIGRGGTSFCICLIDLDHFKQVNDSYGHNAGDTVLKAFAGMTTRMLRNTDFLARYGGEEFLLFLPQTSLETARVSVERIRKELTLTAYDGLPREFRIAMSAGIAQCDGGEEISELIGRADRALYRAKQGGRNKTEVG